MLGVFQGHTDELWGLASHPFRDMFLTCAQDRQVCMWNSSDHSLEWTRLVEVRGGGGGGTKWCNTGIIIKYEVSW